MKQVNAIGLFLFLLSLLVVFTYGSSIFLIASQRLHTDLLLTYLSGEMLNAHIQGYHLSKAFQIAHQLPTNNLPNLSPPFSLMLATIAAKYLSYKSFFALFMCTTIFINLYALTQLYQYIYPQKKTAYHLSLHAFVLANLIYLPTFINISLGQVALLLNALVIFSYLALARGKEILAGFLLALASNIKLFFGIFLIYFLAKKKYKALSSMIIFCLIFGVTPILIYGISIYTGYWSVLSSVTWYGVNWNASLYGFLSRLLGDPSHRVDTLFSLPKLTKSAYYVFFSIYISLSFYLSRKNKHATGLSFSFFLTTMLLISPLGWNYYFPILITALLINLTSAKSHHYHAIFTSILLFSVFISSLPFPILMDYKSTSIILTSHNDIFFFSLLLFNLITLLQLSIPPKENRAPLISRKITFFIITICLLPSFIGLCNISFGNLKALSSPKKLEQPPIIQGST